MPEIIKGFVPRLAVNPLHGLGTKSHAMLVTDARTVLLPWRDAKIQLGTFLYGGVILASGFADSGRVFDPEIWARQPGAVVIPHSFVDGLRCRRTLNTYSFVVEFKQAEGPKKITGFLLPSGEYLRRGRKAGVRPSASAHVYAEETGKIFHDAPLLAKLVDWQI